MAEESAKLRIYSGYSSKKGQARQRNEDAVIQRRVSLGYLAAVADGMAGHAAGEAAATTTLRLLVQEADVTDGEPGKALRRGFEVANEAIRDRAQEDGTTMGATCVAAIVSGGKLHVAHVGDARAYLLRGANLYALTRDHSLRQEIEDLKGREIAEEFGPQLKHIMSRSVGADETIDPTVREPLMLEAGDTILLCSDGLVSVVDDATLQRVLAGGTPREAAIRLVERALEAGGKDDITALVLRVDADTVADIPHNMTLEEIKSLYVQTSDGDMHPVSDILINPSTWTVVGLRLDLAGGQAGAQCEVPIADIGPLSSARDVITTPQRTAALYSRAVPPSEPPPMSTRKRP